MRWPLSFKASLSGKFLLSYLLIVLVGVATLLVITFALAPTLFEAQLSPILQTHPAALTTAEASQRILGAFLGTLLGALAVSAIVATVTSLATSLFVARRITIPREMMNMMYGFGGLGGWWLIGMGMMVLFLIAVVALVIWVMRSLFPRQTRTGYDQALETLRQRYARGEINAAEYEQARARLEQLPVG